MSNKKYKIAIAVQGRFHAFELAKGLLDAGHHVVLFTNYPAPVLEKSGIPKDFVRSFVLHGILLRIFLKLRNISKKLYPEAFLHRLFGRWVCRELEKEVWDVIHCWSGVSEELLLSYKLDHAYRFLCRGSAHIGEQLNILLEEEKRVGVVIEKPSSWMISREKREYDLADGIRVVSDYAHQSFIKHGVSEKKVINIASGLPTQFFCVKDDVIQERCSRIQSESHLRVVYVGNLSFQKGFFDLAEIVKQLSKEPIDFRFVGEVQQECETLLQKISTRVEVVGKVSRDILPQHYAWADVFLFPTLQEGFPQVVAQAFVSGLPIITTPAGAANGLVVDGKTGWVVPERGADLFVKKIRWCMNEKNDFSEMVKYVRSSKCDSRSWEQVAKDFEIHFETMNIGHEGSSYPMASEGEKSS